MPDGPAEGIQVDHGGYPRLVGGKVDIGAFEYQSAFYSESKRIDLPGSHDFGQVGVEIRLESLTDDDNVWATISVDRRDEKPARSRTSESDSLITVERSWGITSIGHAFESANVKFNNITEIAGETDPEELTLFSRPEIGSGFFIPIEQALYDVDQDAFIADVPGFSEFVLGIGTTDVPVSIDDILAGIPDSYGLDQNYPNPFNPTTTIGYQLPQQSDVRLEVFDMIGRRVAILVDGTVQAGYHRVEFNASSLASGVYFYRMAAGEEVISRKLTLIK